MFNQPAELIFEHAAIFTKDEGVFVRARNRISGKIQLLFLIESQKKAYLRNSLRNCWDLLEANRASVIQAEVRQEISRGLVVLVVKGGLETIITDNS